MRGMTHRWTIGAVTEDQHATVAAGPSVSACHPLVARFLRARGVIDPEDVRIFCDPRLTRLHDPSLMPDLDRAAQRLLDAMAKGEKVVIYGDYDVDGVCASSILWHTLTAIYNNGPAKPGTVPNPPTWLSTYVPHRLDEGYGLHVDALEQLARDGAQVIVTVDCAVTAVAAADLARELGVDLIITDHHNIKRDERGEAILPAAYAIVHPRRPGSSYPFGELCGAGVAFKLAWRLATMAAGSERVDADMRTLLLDLLALAGLATVADVVPLQDENRIITKFGLARLKTSGLVGVRALMEASGLTGERVGTEEAGFALGPRLNACGRMGHAREAVEMFTTADPDRARAIATELNKLNEQRRATERRIFDQATRAAEQAGMTNSRRAIVLADEAWHPGVVGIVCSRLVGAYQRPAILMQRAGGICQGSGRSIDGFDLHGALVRCSHLLDRFGGHDMAAGLALQDGKLDEFIETFCAVADEMIADEMLTPALNVDCEASIDELSYEAVNQLLALGPFGRGNPTPKILIRSVDLPRAAEAMGAHGRHISMHARQRQRSLRMIGWNMGAQREMLRVGTALDVIITPTINTWNGRSNIEAEIRDLRIHDHATLGV